LDVGLGFHDDDFLSMMKKCNPHPMIQTQFAGEPIRIDSAGPIGIRRRGLIASAHGAPPDAIRSAFGLSIQIGAAGLLA
jgi:hypothetical protein